MTDFSKSKIYKIVCNETNDIYIGSTTLTLEHRLSAHIRNKDCSSRQIMDRGNYDMTLIEKFPCNSYLELRMREQFYMDTIPNINKIRAHITADQTRIQTAIYQKEHKNKLVIYHKKYNKKNKDKIAIRKKEYHKENKNKIAIYKKKYRKENKEYIKFKRKFTYDWGITFNYLNVIDDNLFD